MSVFTLAISCLTISNLPWFVDLIFQAPMQYCSLQHWILLSSPVTSTTGCCFHWGSVSSFFLELLLHWSPVAYWAPTDLESSSSSAISFSLSYCSWSSQGKNTEVVCHSLLQWTMFCQNSPLNWWDLIIYYFVKIFRAYVPEYNWSVFSSLYIYHLQLVLIAVQFGSVALSCKTLCDPMDCSTPGFPVHQQLPELTQMPVHWVGDAIQPSHPLSSPSPHVFNLSRYQGLF